MPIELCVTLCNEKNAIAWQADLFHYLAEF
jgi:hypothetical protein